MVFNYSIYDKITPNFSLLLLGTFFFFFFFFSLVCYFEDMKRALTRPGPSFHCIMTQNLNPTTADDEMRMHVFTRKKYCSPPHYQFLFIFIDTIGILSPLQDCQASNIPLPTTYLLYQLPKHS